MNNSATNDQNNQTNAAEYEQALDFLYSFINFEAKKQDRYMASKLDHTRPGRLMEALSNPHTHFPAIHIAGTKGKGSTAAICAYTLRAAGYTVGLYTSPHLQDFRERIRILTPDDANGRISQQQFIQQINKIRALQDQFPDITWFEILTAIAFLHFADVGVDVAIVEVGLGGRLDATNVLTPLVSVITRLSLDHTDLLGNTLTEIAYEKGGIIKPGIPVVTANQEPEALAKLQEIAGERGCELTIVGQDWQYAGENTPQSGQQILTITHSAAPEQIPAGSQLTLPLDGDHQLENGTVALAALQQVQPQFPKLTLPLLQSGFASVKWPGRLDLIHPGPAGRLRPQSRRHPQAARCAAPQLPLQPALAHFWRARRQKRAADAGRPAAAGPPHRHDHRQPSPQRDTRAVGRNGGKIRVWGYGRFQHANRPHHHLAASPTRRSHLCHRLHRRRGRFAKSVGKPTIPTVA